MLVNKLICVASADQTAQICYFIITPTREKNIFASRQNCITQ